MVIGLVSAWVSWGQILAALVGPLALRTSGWQALWIASLLLACLLAGWALYTLRRSPHGAALQALSPETAPHLSRVRWSAHLLPCGVFMLSCAHFLAYMSSLPLSPMYYHSPCRDTPQVGLHITFFL